MTTKTQTQTTRTPSMTSREVLSMVPVVLGGPSIRRRDAGRRGGFVRRAATYAAGRPLVTSSDSAAAHGYLPR